MFFMHCNHPLWAGCNGPKAIALAPVEPIYAETSTAQSAGKSGTDPLFLVVTTICDNLFP